MSVRTILRGGNHQKWVVAGGLGARNRVLSHVAQDMVHFWFEAVGGKYVQFWGLLGAFWGRFADVLWS